MTLIKCPKCGHTVLSAATRCPSCAGYMDPDQRDVIRVDRKPRLWLLLPGVLVAALVGVVVWRAQADGSFTGNFTPGASPAAQMPQPLPLVPPIDTVAAQQPADSTTQQDSPGGETAHAPQAVARREEGPSPAEKLWTRTWVNVRERPGTTGTVVKILTPGQPVDVINPERQWSLVYVDGQALGYLSVALLAEQPPGL